MLTLYDGTTAGCAIKVRRTLAEKGLAWESRTLDLRRGDQFEVDYTIDAKLQISVAPGGYLKCVSE